MKLLIHCEEFRHLFKLTPQAFYALKLRQKVNVVALDGTSFVDLCDFKPTPLLKRKISNLPDIERDEIIFLKKLA